MLLFSTILDINEQMTRERFFDLIIEWNNTQYYEENIIPNLEWKGEFGKRLGDDRLWLSCVEYESTIAVRYEKCSSDGIVWDTDYVMNFRNMKMAIRLERSFSEEALALDAKFSSPYFISLLIDKGYLKADNKLPLQRGPTYINVDNLNLVADVINGKAKYKHPVIYVSKSQFNENPLDVDALSKKLRGMAHVLVQEDIDTNKELQRICSQKNEYRGSIGLYFPNETTGHKKLKYRREVGPDPMLMDRVIQSVLQYCNAQMIQPLFTWQGINNATIMNSLEKQQSARMELESKYRDSEQKRLEMEETRSEEANRVYEDARRKAEDEAMDLLASYDEDERRLKEQIQELTDQNNSLLIENEGMRKKLQSLDGMPLLNRGDEDDFYAGEIKDLILSVLSDALKNITEGTRRFDAVNDIIKHNNYEHISESKGDELKRLIKAYSGMPAQLRNDLEALGFQISDGGKHYKVQYYGDPRYTETMSKTPSDWKTGQITSAKLKKRAF